jgi:hypothetical protein
MLVDKMYSWRKYDFPSSAPAGPNDPARIVLVIYDVDHAIATATLGLDSEFGLLADELYRTESDELRREGRQLCEMTKLAVEHVVRSKRVLASLFHIALIYARYIHRRDDCLIEINPRHVKFYEAMLGFEPLGDMKDLPEGQCARPLASARPAPRGLENPDLRRPGRRVSRRALALSLLLLEGRGGGEFSAGSRH